MRVLLEPAEIFIYSSSSYYYYYHYHYHYYYYYYELTHSKSILENTTAIEQQPVALNFKKLSQYSSHSK